jgi:cysteinyl-tRNA synthetase
LRLALLKTHYRQPLDFTKDGVREARQELNRFYRALALGEAGGGNVGVIPKGVLDGLSDDLNAPLALTGVHAAADAVFAADKDGDAAALAVAIGALKAAGSLLGLLQHDPQLWFQGDGDEAIDALIEERNAARADKDFARADEIRDQLDAQGIVLEDGAGGTTWRREN